MRWFSKYESGSYRDGHWYCACGDQLHWRTSKQPDSFGREFASCTRPESQKCRFFLARADETHARTKMAPTAPPVTSHKPPPQLSVFGCLSTANNPVASQFTFPTIPSSSQADPVNSPDPATARRRTEEPADDLAARVLRMLRRDKVVLTENTKFKIRYMIETRIAEYEAREKMSKRSLQQVFENLDLSDMGGAE